MREILFRGKDEHSKWIYGDLIHNQFEGITRASIVNNGFFTPVAGDSIGQYTGLKDINGKKIFEGDIVRIDDEKDSIYYVKYFGEHNYPAFDLSNEVSIDCNGISYAKEMGIEVIGNIYDNPELL